MSYGQCEIYENKPTISDRLNALSNQLERILNPTYVEIKARTPIIFLDNSEEEQ